MIEADLEHDRRNHRRRESVDFAAPKAASRISEIGEDV